MTKYILDTNHASRLMANDAALMARMRQLQQAGDEFSVSMTIVAELYYAVYASRRQAENRRLLDLLLKALHVYPFEQPVAEEFGRIQAEQKAKGRPIPPLDAQIAAVARHYGLTVLTADKHFKTIDGLAMDNWLAV